ncbi:MAG: bifunctional phosphoribosyl-AMP cyclohydrolase/phosphoribosyl-ATP diphosphatase HisIE [Synergistaceae bacterium]|jgi:phosphoribosyl-ATP pyrophosphohydrolase/phosphoribosyl-AMP cyclohydrolase|nr:bifunctional phosphoribosyl-AMP cyclohydrolase/phosphoribosyl-ATP diphosphatase HisIE [Synergistaceae bacterium]
MLYDSARLDDIAFGTDGLVPTITQDADTREVLMLAWMNRESLQKTLDTGMVHYYSRSRACLWLKGETSGHFQKVREIRRDCDSDALLILAEQTGAACHTGNRSCFYRDLAGENVPEPTEPARPARHEDILSALQSVIEDRRAHPKEGSYTNYLFEKGIDKMLKKVGEESAEIIIAAKNPSQSDLVGEIADMMFHVSVVLAERGLSWRDICAELERRRKK